MDGEVQVTLRGYQSASDYEITWESDCEVKDSKFMYHSRGGTDVWHDKFTLHPGSFLFVHWYPSDFDERRILIQVPIDRASFEQFLEAARKAEHNDSDDGDWTFEFSVATWNMNDDNLAVEDYPFNLAEAIEMHKHQGS